MFTSASGLALALLTLTVTTRALPSRIPLRRIAQKKMRPRSCACASRRSPSRCPPWLSSGYDTDASPSEAASTARARAAVTTSGFSSTSQSLVVGESTKGSIPKNREECLSRRDRGVEKSGTVLTSGTKWRVPRKSRKLAKPKTDGAAAGRGSSQIVFLSGLRSASAPPSCWLVVKLEELTSEREYQVRNKGETVRHAGTGVAREARY